MARHGEQGGESAHQELLTIFLKSMHMATFSVSQEERQMLASFYGLLWRPMQETT